MANKYLDENGLLYFWQKIKAAFVQDVTYDATTKTLKKTKNGADSNVLTVSTIKTDLELTKSDVGLGNVDNTSDANKPISTATQTALDGKVDKVTGKGLSTNDYTTTEKNKLAGIAAGAEVNQNAFSNVKVGETTVAADSKTDTLELVAGSNITLTPDATNDKVTIAATVPDVSNFMVKGVDYVTAGQKSGTTLGSNATAEGALVESSAYCSHAEGYATKAAGASAHAEGSNTEAGSSAHAEGSHTIARGPNSHAEGAYTTANRKNQHVFGKYNSIESGDPSTEGTYVEIVGNGTASDATSNARTLDWDGNEVLAGKLTVGAGPTNNMDVATKQYVDTNGGKIDVVKRNGTALTITNKEVDVSVPIASAQLDQNLQLAVELANGNTANLLTETWWVSELDRAREVVTIRISGGSATFDDSEMTPVVFAGKFVGVYVDAIIIDNNKKVYYPSYFNQTTGQLSLTCIVQGVVDEVSFSAPASMTTPYGTGVAYSKTIQGYISDLATIRSGAAAGTTALQKKSAAGIVYSAADSTTTSAATAAQIVSAIGNTAVNRATADASGNTITTTYAPLASPALTGTPTAPTATAGTSSTQIATTAFVQGEIATAITGSASFQGTVSAQSTITNSNYKKGWYWVVDTAGTYVGQTCEVGDMIYAIADKTSAYSASDFSVVQTNLDLVAITNAEIDTIVAA